MPPLLAVVVAGGTLGLPAPLLLGRLERLDRTPQTAAYLWIIATFGALSAVVLAGLLLVVGSSRLLTDLAVLLRTCTMALRAALDTPSGAAEPLLGLALLALVAGGLLGGGLLTGIRAWRAARGQRELLTLAGQTQPGLPGVTILDHPVPLAYCLPGRSRRRPGAVVVTTAALEQLDHVQLQAVLAHERAHQASRHHALLLVAQALGIGFPWLPAARAAHHAVARLVELAADDAAIHHHRRADVANALAKLATAPTPTLGLGASGPTTLERVHRLTTPPRQRPRRHLAAGPPAGRRPTGRRAGGPDHSPAARGRHADLPDHLTVKGLDQILRTARPVPCDDGRRVAPKG
jgi:Zn-dependent protease with chaperone function